MSRNPSIETKLKQHRGDITHSPYRPFIEVREINSMGTGTIYPDPVTHRQMHFLSQGEFYTYLLLRWNCQNVNIWEQVVLDLPQTIQIAESLGLKHPGGYKNPMTTDLLTQSMSGEFNAYSVKVSEDDIAGSRAKERLFIEKLYWNNHKVRFHLIFKDRLNIKQVQNIRLCTEYAEIERVHTGIDLVKHMMFQRLIETNMDKDIVDFAAIAKEIAPDDKTLQAKILECKHMAAESHGTRYTTLL